MLIPPVWECGPSRFRAPAAKRRKPKIADTIQPKPRLLLVGCRGVSSRLTSSALLPSPAIPNTPSAPAPTHPAATPKDLRQADLPSHLSLFMRKSTIPTFGRSAFRLPSRRPSNNDDVHIEQYRPPDFRQLADSARECMSHSMASKDSRGKSELLCAEPPILDRYTPTEGHLARISVLARDAS